MVRLDAQVSSLFGVKQSEARALIASGEVSVNGAPQREPRWQVVLGEEATLTVGGRAPPTGRPFAHRLLLVHKPGDDPAFEEHGRPQGAPSRTTHPPSTSEASSVPL